MEDISVLAVQVQGLNWERIQKKGKNFLATINILPFQGGGSLTFDSSGVNRLVGEEALQ